MLRFLMWNLPLFHIVLAAVALVAVVIVVVSLFNTALFEYCTIRCCIALMLHYLNFALVFAEFFNVAMFHDFTILTLHFNNVTLEEYCTFSFCSINNYCINCYFKLCKWLVFAFLVLYYCIMLKFHYLIIVFIVAHFHAILLLSNYVMLHFKVN